MLRHLRREKVAPKRSSSCAGVAGCCRTHRGAAADGVVGCVATRGRSCCGGCSTSRCWCARTAGARGGCWPQSRRRRQSNGCCGRWACRTRRRWWRRPGRRRVMRSGGEHEGDGRSGCEQGVVAGPGCVLGQQIRAERPASRARGGGLTGACQGRIGVVVGFGWAGPQLEPPTHSCPEGVVPFVEAALRERRSIPAVRQGGKWSG